MNSQSRDFQGKVVFITGGAVGFGRAFAREFCARAALGLEGGRLATSEVLHHC